MTDTQNIAALLKRETRGLHDQVEENLNSQAILSEDYSQEEYARLLLQLYRAHLSLEPKILSFDRIMHDTRLQTTRRLYKAHLLEEDLRSLGHRPAKVGMPLRLRNLSEAWGALYVLEGSTLGGAMILKQLRKHNWPRQPFAYYGYYGSDTGPMWKSFRELLQENWESGQLNTDDLLSGARKAYGVFMGKVEV